MRSSELIVVDEAGPGTVDDDLPEARLGDAPHLQALHEPSPRLDLSPRHILQQARPETWSARLRHATRIGSAAVAVHLVLAGAFYAMLSFREIDTPQETEEPVEWRLATAVEAPKPVDRVGKAEAPANAGLPAAPASPVRPDLVATGTQTPSPPRQTTAANSPAPPERDQRPELKPGPEATLPRPSPPVEAPPQPMTAPGVGAPSLPKLIEPPPEAPRSATQDRENTSANLQPYDAQIDQATREAKPAAVPRTLTTRGPDAAFTVPLPAAPKTEPTDKPTPPIPVKAPSAADKLAAALPMDTTAMPMSFRSVLAGNATTQINAAYGSVVQSRVQLAQAGLAEAAYAQRLSGAVALRFTIDEVGKLGSIVIVKSSGNAALDALALQSIESAAPFPPPPPEADRTFQKALLIGR